MSPHDGGSLAKHTFAMSVQQGRFADVERMEMTIRSYLVELTAQIGVMVDDSLVNDGEFYDQIIEKANEITSDEYFDYNKLTYSVKVCGHMKDHG